MQAPVSLRLTGSNAIRKKQEAASRHDAILLFNDAKKRLLDITHWHLLYEEQAGRFTLADAQGGPVQREMPQEGDLICVDWVDGTRDSYRIEQFHSEKNQLKDEEKFGFTARSVPGPEAADPATAAKETVLKFLIVRNANVVVAMESISDSRRSLVRSLLKPLMALGRKIVSFFGVRRHEWQSLVNGLITGPGHRWDKKVI